MVDYTKIFHTVPFTAKTLERLPSGTKTDPGFPRNGWSKYEKTQNTNNTPVLGAIARNDFIGIDIDITQVFQEALKLDNDTAEYIAKSDLKGGHLIYAYNKEDAERLKVISKDAKAAKIDIQMGSKLIYLATEANKTKRLLTLPLTKAPEVRIPLAVILLLESYAYRALLANPAVQIANHTQTAYNSNMLDSSTLGYLLEVEEAKYNIDKIIPQKLEPKHPRDIEEGNGTEWMNSVRFKLAQDPSVSEDKFKAFMLWLNQQWEDPMEESRVLRDCNYDIKNRLNSVTGDVLWRYNPNWKTEGFTYPDIFGNMLEVIYDPAQQLFIEHNKNTNDITLYTKQTDVVNAIMSKGKGRQKLSGEKILKKADPVSLVNTPELRPGKLVDTNTISKFNMFRPSDGVLILNGILEVKEPKHPEYTLKFFENLIVDEENRLRLFKFLAYKHRTYEHSSLYFVFAGVGGAGKGIFIDIFLEYFASEARIQGVNLEKLLNNFNSWRVTTDYVILDEAGEGESKHQQEKLVKELKELTGKSKVNITFKGKETGGAERHYMTPMLTTNMTTKLVTDSSKNDRRLVLFRCPNKLSKITNDTGKFIDILRAELPHFAHYLSTLPVISNNEYTDNKLWKNADYHDYIETTLEPIDKLVEAIEDQNLQGVIDVLTEDLSLLPQQIDNLFIASKLGEEARLLVYNTTATRELNIQSLVDIADTSTLLDASEVKLRFKKLKTKVIYMPVAKRYNLNVVKILGNYTPIAGIEVEDISGDLLDIELD